MIETKVKVTVFLKSGGEAVSDYYGETIQEIKERYIKIFTDKEVLVISGMTVTQMIPSDNISAIEIREVAE